MNATVIQCPHCNAALEVDAPGESSCYNCGGAIAVAPPPAPLPPVLPKPKTFNCPTCRNTVSPSAAACPHCGHPLKYRASTGMGVFLGLIMFFIVLPILIFLFLAFAGVITQ